ncbi:flavodoxin family protein [Pseudovibrio sp. Tun.PSC04-5.I4]|uniref:flavodoxin family protein n=1 Tax=Pseudovibrio sp. Tun.PSC04-5.I4 TaxID=1798213 RepID=UPI00088BA440|nr:flavodoxin family protein [Pseudovibrio sp. Tun.PSC04-5.I4]SDR47484.1 Multimeric flavodoxin WrbA [Pseudovibrio sp. Tun.PSC04-5.I4]
MQNKSVSIAVAYHSGFGHTETLAKSVVTGINAVEGATGVLVDVTQLNGDFTVLNAADAIILGSPTYLGSVSGPFKMFMDETSKIFFGRGWQNKLAAGFTVSASRSGDKMTTIVQMTVFAAQHGMIWVGANDMAGNNSSAGSENDINRLGSYLGMMAQANVDEGPEVAPPAADHQTAESFGKRIADASLRWGNAPATQPRELELTA